MESTVILLSSVLVMIILPSLTYGQNTCAGVGLSRGCCRGSYSSCQVGTSCYCDEVCRTVYDDCCSDVPSQLRCPVAISPALFQAIMRVESNGNIDAVGDGGLAIGPFQIHNVYWLDAVAHDPSLRANGQTYQNCRGTGSIAYSKRVIQAYMNRYATSARLEHIATDEDIARIHNGGLNGYNNPNTVAYWNRVRIHLSG